MNSDLLRMDISIVRRLAVERQRLAESGEPVPGVLYEAADAIESEVAENARLREFAQLVMEAWPYGDLDGGALQEAAIDCGLLVPETRHERCGEACPCAEACMPDEFAEGVTCYRRTPLLTGQSEDVCKTK